MTHEDFIKANFKVLAETQNTIFFDADGEKVAEINGETFDCETAKESCELVDFYDDETFEV